MTEDRHARDANIFLTAEGLTTSPCKDKVPTGECGHDVQTPTSKAVLRERTINIQLLGKTNYSAMDGPGDYFKKDKGERVGGLLVSH